MEIQFDPGFIQHISAFVPNIEYMYSSLDKFRNFNQKKMQFKMYYPKLQNLIKNYIGFYSGCILWALYIKQFKNEDILNNLCLDGEYSEDETLFEVKFLKQYLNQMQKDVKYYIGQDYKPEEIYFKIIDVYEEFLKLNEGFVKTQKTDDIKLPNLKALSKDDLDEIKKDIDKSLETGKLSELIKSFEKVM